MEKMITLAESLNVSLDYLVYGCGEGKKEREKTAIFTGRILIKAYNEKKVVNCYKVRSFPVSTKIFKSKPDEPQYALFGIDNSSFFGENRELLGWYADESSIQKEIDAIYIALGEGDSIYELQYAAKVKEGFLSVKLL